VLFSKKTRFFGQQEKPVGKLVKKNINKKSQQQVGFKPESRAIVEFLDYQIPVTQLVKMRMRNAKVLESVLLNRFGYCS